MEIKPHVSILLIKKNIFNDLRRIVYILKLNQILLFKGNCKLLKCDKMWVWVMDGRATHSQSQSNIFSNSQSHRSELTQDAHPNLLAHNVY